ncbi:MAG: hypothetical protein JO138_24435 [Acidobacteriaceae bacterium]|nr:hypothetical protein [Acidobacteriaceae bacterium]
MIGNCILLAIVLPLASIGQALVPDPAPVPYLNADGSIPKGEESHTIFLDPGTGDAVAIYKPSGEGAAKANSVRVSVPLSRNIDPSITTTIEYRTGSGEFRYEYVLCNGSKARQPAYIWFFVGLLDSKEIVVEHPPMWLSHFPENVAQDNIALRSLAVMVRNPGVNSSNLPNVPGVFPRQQRPGLTFVSQR